MQGDLAALAIDVLGRERWTRTEAVSRVEKKPGLYAFYGDARAWSDLGLRPTFEGQPLYVGKAERSLNGRDVGTHFATGKTGSSTVRRSLAALLAPLLDLTPVPRNLAAPDGSANFGFEVVGDQRLSVWMDSRLLLATWAWSGDARLGDVETAVLGALRPPLNLAKVGEPRASLREARARMAAIARAHPG